MDEDGNDATMGGIELSVSEGSLNSVVNEHFRGADAKAQIFWKPNMWSWRAARQRKSS